MPKTSRTLPASLSLLILVLSIVTTAAQGGGRGGFGAGATGQGPAGGGRGQAGQGGPGGAGGRGAPRDTAEPAVGTASISGAVMLDGGGTPVRRARVTVTGAELRGNRSVTTDDNGQFSFQALPAGRFTMTASKPGFVDNSYGAKRPGRPGTPIQLADGQKLERATITLPRGGVITGIVVDEHGEPTAGIQVRALRYVLRTGERTLQQAGQDQTDDRGVYRIFQLQPGEYVVNALPRANVVADIRNAINTQITNLMQQMSAAGVGAGGRGGGIPGQAGLAALANNPQVADRLAQLQQQLAAADQEQASAYAPVYYPGTISIGTASTITLNVSEERPSVDFQLQLVPTARVEGVVTAADGNLPQGTQVALVSAERGAAPLLGLGTNTARVGAGGRFSFPNVTPGEYTLQARATVRDPNSPDPAAQGRGGGGRGGAGGFGPGAGAVLEVLWASEAVSVNGRDITGAVLNLQPGLEIGGRVEFQGAQPLTDLSRVRVSLSPRGTQGGFEIGTIPPAQTDGSGRFVVKGVPPGTYTMSATVTAPAQQAAPVGGQAAGARGGLPAGGRGGAAATAQTSWTLKSAMVNGRDVLDFPLEVGPNGQSGGAVLTFTDRTQELSGMIQDTAGRPTADFTIILFPSDRRFWIPQARRILSTRPGTDGKFTFRSLPSGDYRLTAVTDVEPGEWYDPAFLAQLQGVSIPISLAEGDRKVQDIRLAGN